MVGQTFRFSAIDIPAVMPVWAENRVWPPPVDADYSMIFEVDFQPGAGSQPWALQRRLEHEDQIPPVVPVAPAGGDRLRFR